MAINFPNSPLIGQTYLLNGKRYFWDGIKWKGSNDNIQPECEITFPGSMPNILFASSSLNTSNIEIPEVNTVNLLETYELSV